MVAVGLVGDSRAVSKCVEGLTVPGLLYRVSVRAVEADVRDEGF